MLGRRIQEIGLGLLDLLLRARKCPHEERGDLLHQADLELDRLRYTVRLCHEIDLLSQQAVPARRRPAGRDRQTCSGTWIKRYNRATVDGSGRIVRCAYRNRNNPDNRNDNNGFRVASSRRRDGPTNRRR